MVRRPLGHTQTTETVIKLYEQIARGKLTGRSAEILSVFSMFFVVFGTIFFDMIGSNLTIPFSYVQGDLTYMDLLGDESFAISRNVY